MEDQITFVVDPALIAIGGVVVPFLVEVLTKAKVPTYVKQNVASAVVVLVVLGSLALDLFVEHSIKVDSTEDVLTLIMLVLAQLTIVRIAVEGGHRLYDSLESDDRNMSNVLFPNFGFGRKKAA